MYTGTIVPPQPFYSFRETMLHLFSAANYLLEMNQLLPSRIPESTLGKFMAMFHGNGFDIENVDAEIGFTLNDPVDEMLQLSTG
jgi:hypothetical protein